VNWLAWYAGLAAVTAFLVVYVALCAFVSELDAVKYRLQQEVAFEQSRQAKAVRSINDRADYDALRPVIEARRLTTRPAGVLTLPAASALPAEMPTVLRTPQPYRAYASSPPAHRPQGPVAAGLR